MELDFDPKDNVTKLDLLLAIPLNRAIIRFKELQMVLKYVYNWYSLLLFRVKIKRSVEVHFRDGYKIKFISLSDYFKYFDEILKKPIGMKTINLKIKTDIKEISITYKNHNLRFSYDNNTLLANTIWMLREQFLQEQYKNLNVTDRVVIDIGANIGDTAIYFAVNGAAHVYAFEPYTYSYLHAIKNVILNHLKTKITLLNEGCGKNNDEITVDSSYTNIASSELKKTSLGHRIKIYTLKSIIDKHHINDNAILKIDCEGCEYGAILHVNDNVLRKFKHIQGEYHYGYKNIEKKLKDAGFRVKHTIPTKDLSHGDEGFNGLFYARLL